MVPRQSRALQGAAPCPLRPVAEDLDRENPEIRAARAGEGRAVRSLLGEFRRAGGARRNLPSCARIMAGCALLTRPTVRGWSIRKWKPGNPVAGLDPATCVFSVPRSPLQDVDGRIKSGHGA